METGSPDWISLKIQDFRDEFELRVAQSESNFNLLFLVALFIIGTITAYFYAGLRYTQEFSEIDSFRYSKLYYSYPFLAALSIFFVSCFFLSKKKINLDLMRSLFFIGAFLLLCIDRDRHFNVFLGLYFMTAATLTIAVFWLSLNFEPLWRRLVAFLFFSLILFVSSYLSSGWEAFEVLHEASPQRFIFLIYIAFATEYTTRATSLKQFTRSILFPFQLIYPLPTQLYYWDDASDTEHRLIVIKGIVDLFICSLLTIGLLNIRVLENLTNEFGIIAFLKEGLLSYLSVYLFSCVSISVPVAIARILGYRFPSAYNLPLLAASPQDRWRRWNTYFYNFYCWIFFIPFYKKTKSLFLAVMLTFLITSFFHSNSESFLVHVTADLPLQVSRSIVCFFLLHGFVVYGGLKWKSPLLNGEIKKGWAGVILTWIAMILIHNLQF